jgi:hypothetical protein
VHAFLADREGGKASQLLKDFVEFEQPQCSAMHEASIAQGKMRMKMGERRVAP